MDLVKEDVEKLVDERIDAALGAVADTIGYGHADSPSYDEGGQIKARVFLGPRDITDEDRSVIEELAKRDRPRLDALHDAADELLYGRSLRGLSPAEALTLQWRAAQDRADVLREKLRLLGVEPGTV